MSDLNMIKPANVQGIINKFCLTIGMLPTSYKLSLTYEEQILAIGRYLEENVYPAINNNAEALLELQNLYQELKDYVDSYFEDLDIEEEINKKLDEMAESGELTEIIAQYLQLAGLLCYNTVNDMKNADNLIDGSFAKTFGETTYNDGKGNFYKIRTITSDDVIDEINIIKILNDNSLIAELIPNKTINDILTEINVLNNNIDDLNLNKLSTVYGVNSSENLSWHLYYVDNINGNDNNVGSENEPFKTLQPILNLINKGKLKIDIALKRGQTHLLNANVFNSCTIHFQAYGDGTNNAILTRNILPTTNNNSLVFYNCHLNFENITLVNIGYDVYNDGGSMVAKNTIFDCKYTTWSCGCRFSDCIIKTLKARMANLWFENSKIGCIDSNMSSFQIYKPVLYPNYDINHEDLSACYVFHGGTVLIYGASSINTDIAPSHTRLLWFTGSFFSLLAGPNVSVTGNNFSEQSRCDGTKIVATAPRLNTLYNSANGIIYDNGTEYPQ